MHYPVAGDRETALACFFHRKNVAALVGPALLAGAMRQLALVAVGALGKAGRSQKIVAAALGSPLFGMAPFWIRHCSIPLESSNQSFKTKISIRLPSQPITGPTCLPAPQAHSIADRPQSHRNCTLPHSDSGHSAGTALCSPPYREYVSAGTATPAPAPPPQAEARSL